MYDVGIIGAGPVGSYIAYKMSKLGHSVLVLDKKHHAGQDICCTGIIGKDCLDLLNLDNEIVLRKANSATFFSPSGRYFTLQREGDVAYILDRPLLNERLKERAQAAGAEYMFSCHIKDMEITETKVKLFTSSASNGIIEVKTAVIASGYGSNLAGKLGLGGISSFTIGAQAEVELTGVRGVEIYLDQSLTAGSFAWLVPTCGGKGLAGLMADKQPKAKLQSLLSLLIKNNKIHSADISLSCAAIPLHSRQTTFTNRVLVTGEAAGHIKPVTGGGLYFGLLGADIAIAELHGALLDGDVSAKRLHIYQQRWKKLLDREMRIGMILRKIWSALGNRQIECLFSLADNRRMADFIANSDDFSFDWHGRLLLKSLKLMSSIKG